jgi:hypothetical protein
MCDKEDRNSGATTTGSFITSLKTTEFLTNNNMVIVPYPPYSPGLAPSDFALLAKLKMKLKGRFETVSDIQRELQAVLDTIKENDFHSAFEAWKTNDGIAVYVPKETILMEMAAKIKLSQNFFFGLVRELSDTPRIYESEKRFKEKNDYV